MSKKDFKLIEHYCNTAKKFGVILQYRLYLVETRFTL
jgi:hypothetical protein